MTQALREDREALGRLLASPDADRAIRCLEVMWCKRGVGATPQETAYRVGRRDAVEELKAMREEARS
jgi:hypothetical protein